MEIGAVLPDEEVLRRVLRDHHGEEGKPVDLLDEARVQPGLARKTQELFAEHVLAHGAGKGSGKPEPRAHARHVPGRAATTGVSFPPWLSYRAVRRFLRWSLRRATSYAWT